MRWKANSGPQLGDTRIVTKFLWKPKTIEGETRWLETASWFERRILTTIATPCGPCDAHVWHPVCWEDLTR